MSARGSWGSADQILSSDVTGNSCLAMRSWVGLSTLAKIDILHLRSVNECFDKGEMSCSQKEAVIFLVERKGNIVLFWKIDTQFLL